MSKSATKELTTIEHPIDKTTGKVDLAIALEMRLKKGKTFQEIADFFHVSPQAVHQRLRDFMTVIQSPEALQAFQNSKQDILSAVEFKLVSQLLDADKLKGASINNIAYALQNVFNMNRLEQDKSTSNVAHALRFEVIEHDKDQGQEQEQWTGAREQVDHNIWDYHRP